MIEGSEDNETGFLDVAANTLAVILIVTLFAIQTIQQETRYRVDPYAEEPPTLAFPITTPMVFTPYSQYYLVFDDGIVRWRQENAVKAIAESNGARKVSAEGNIIFTPMPYESRDVDSYKLTWTPDLDILGQRLEPLTEKLANEIIAELEKAYVDENISPTFLVFDSGMNAFSMLHERLADPAQRLRWRWYTWEEKRPIKIVRSFRNFTRLDYAW